ncbi:MAG: hypothetical protein NTW08_06710 [Gammaproteobacteria bacterium]|nr:hypothetical protein [Gammaproteobacteria bacterium]
MRVRYKRSLHGVSLIELMIAGSLSSFLVLALWQGLAIHQQTYRVMNQQLTDDVDLVMVSSMLTERIHHAGFTPCLSLAKLVTSDEAKATLLPYQIDNAAHRLTLNRMARGYQDGIKVLGDRQLSVASATVFDLNRVYLIADCSHAELVRVSSHTSNTLTMQQPLRFSYAPPIFLGEWISESFDVVKGKGLMLHALSSDVLSQAIQSFDIQWIKATHLFRLRLGTENHQSHWVVAAMRMH